VIVSSFTSYLCNYGEVIQVIMTAQARQVLTSELKSSQVSVHVFNFAEINIYD